MSKRIFRSIFLVACAVLILCLVIVTAMVYNHFEDLRKEQLAAQTELAAHGVAGQGLAYFQGLDSGDYRLTWVAADGQVLYDSEAEASQMENHAGREEIQEAFIYGAGESERFSPTQGIKTIYRAQRLSDGSVIRMSMTQLAVSRLVVETLPALCAVLLLAVLFSAVLARKLSRRIMEPLGQLDLTKPLDNQAYEELSPLLGRIENQRRQIESQMDKLQKRHDEFRAVTESMSEGLVLLNDKGTVLSMNPAAARLFEAGPGFVGRDILTVNRSRPIQELVATAYSGKRGEAVLALGGGSYQVSASPVFSGGRAAGVCILMFDITEKHQAEALRREFTANVSHELKTPLQSIMGAAELLENGLVKTADMPRFISRIRSEAAHLLSLIEDIIRLSQLDEGAEMPREKTDLMALAREAAQILAPDAQARGVGVSVSGAGATVFGVRRLLYEIIYNLCENAIKYNRENGTVDITVESTPEGAVLTVSDTGIGIPQDQQSRVFQRFYRVEKSHSRQTGGTGLGLSIVKHAAQYHGASVTLESAVGKGTTVRVQFPAGQ